MLASVLRLFHVDHAPVEVRPVQIDRLPHRTLRNVHKRHASELVRLLLPHHANLTHLYALQSLPSPTNLVLCEQLANLVLRCVVGQLAEEHSLSVR